jgi:hypothetical protein
MTIIYEMERQRFFETVDPSLPTDERPIAVRPGMYSDSGRVWSFDTTFNWEKILQLALSGGWKPKGAKRPDYYQEIEELPYLLRLGGYLGDQQIIEADDACAMADALDRCIADLSPSNCEDTLKEYFIFCGVLEAFVSEPLSFELCLPFFKLVTPRVFYGGPEGSKFVRNFAAFCREGGFQIWHQVIREKGFER